MNMVLIYPVQNDRDLKRRVRKIPGVPIVSVGRGKYAVERLPDAPEK